MRALVEMGEAVVYQANIRVVSASFGILPSGDVIHAAISETTLMRMTRRRNCPLNEHHWLGGGYA